MEQVRVTAGQVLRAVRAKYSQGAVVREVTVPDLVEQGRYNRYQADAWANLDPDYARCRIDEIAARGLPLADSVPDGWVPHLNSSTMTRRIDALLREGEKLTAIEVKVARRDFLTETESKRAPWRAVTHRYVYAVPRELVQPDEVPDYCGLWWYDPAVTEPTHYRHGIEVIKQAQGNKTPDPLPTSVLYAMLGRVSRRERVQEEVAARTFGPDCPHAHVDFDLTGRLACRSCRSYVGGNGWTGRGEAKWRQSDFV